MYKTNTSIGLIYNFTDYRLLKQNELLISCISFVSAWIWFDHLMALAPFVNTTIAAAPVLNWLIRYWHAVEHNLCCCIWPTNWSVWCKNLLSCWSDAGESRPSNTLLKSAKQLLPDRWNERNRPLTPSWLRIELRK